MNDSTEIWAAATNDGLWVRIKGPAMADDCPALRLFCESQLTSGRRTLYVALQCCEHFDSTFLGTLLCLQKLHGKAGGDSVVLVAPSETCDQALRRMQAHQLFPIMSLDQPDEGQWTPIIGEVANRNSCEFQQQVLDAHVELAAVPGPLGKLYEPIAKLAQQEYDSRQKASSRQ